jgi:hypothetical protein
MADGLKEQLLHMNIKPLTQAILICIMSERIRTPHFGSLLDLRIKSEMENPKTQRYQNPNQVFMVPNNNT